MQYAVLFILVFLFALLIHWQTRQWKIAVAVPVVLYLIWLAYQYFGMADAQVSVPWSFVLIFELPIVFMASLLASYIFETRNSESDTD